MSARPPEEPATLEIWVQGQRFEVRADIDRATAREVARYVNEKIGEAASGLGPATRLDVVVLAALNIAQEHVELLRQHERLRQAIEEGSRRLVGSIERVL